MLFRATASSEPEVIEVDLVNDFGGSLPVLPARQFEGDHESYLAVVPGQVLSEIYDRWGARLLEQNVRVFLQARSKVNRGIRDTLVHEPDMFFAYNNGITATAEDVEISNDGGSLMLCGLRNFQIVNGGQTTASIHAAMRKKVDISQTFIQMKLSVVNADRAVKLVPKISECANSQNRVVASDFFANHPFHVRVEGFSRRIYAPSPDGTFSQSKWFYERARGQFADARGYLTTAQRRKFDIEFPRRQRFNKTDLAKFLNVWEGRPHEVSLGAQKNFAAFARRIGQAWKKRPDDFSEAWYREAIAKAIVFRATERIVSAQPMVSGRVPREHRGIHDRQNRPPHEEHQTCRRLRGHLASAGTRADGAENDRGCGGASPRCAGRPTRRDAETSPSGPRSRPAGTVPARSTLSGREHWLRSSCRSRRRGMRLEAPDVTSVSSMVSRLRSRWSTRVGHSGRILSRGGKSKG